MANTINGILFCAKCRKPVDRIENGYNPQTGDTVFTAFCHGETESCVLTEEDVRNAIQIDYALAFRGKQKD